MSEYRLLIFYSASIVWLELVFRLWSFKSINVDFVFPALFSLSAGAVIFLLTGQFSPLANRITAVCILALLFFLYGVQLVYFNIFQVPLALFSLTGAGDALGFTDVVFDAILRNLIPLLLLLVPVAVLLVFRGKLRLPRMKRSNLYFALVFFAAVHILSLACVYLTGGDPTSQRMLYYEDSSPTLTASRLGLMTTVRLDLMKLASEPEDAMTVAGEGGGEGDTGEEPEAGAANKAGGTAPVFAEGPGVTAEVATAASTGAATPGTGAAAETGTGAPVKELNIMDIDFGALAAGEKDSVIKDMDEYFSTVEPTRTNKYTGIFKGYNLIQITAESFSPYAISPELTPTLYKMAHEGFVFNNFYDPVWGVSTSDGEYVNCLGLIPKSGVWSMARSAVNYLPFAMGNQFRKLGYVTKAYHDNSYTYYKRNLSHPNLGYDYKALGNGLNVKKTWPESDLEMIELTSGDFTSGHPFHNYYMTVSGHMNYNFTGNYIANKNRARVGGLNLSEASKAYIAGNLELEDAMTYLLKKLNDAGIADRTVIALCPDHYPYGLPGESLDELAGHKLENNFELYKSVFILYKQGMEPVTVEKPCSSLDINPTLSNLFGLEYDSRLLMGRDIFSDASPLVVFSNRSWITDRARFNASTNVTVFTDGTEKDPDYIKSINKIVADKFKYSTKILDTDYYGKIIS